jgi:hypothetical protein
LEGSLSDGKGEDAVAFCDAGNAIPNEKGPSVNAGEQTIKMRAIFFTRAAALTGYSARKPVCLRFARLPA